MITLLGVEKSKCLAQRNTNVERLESHGAKACSKSEKRNR